MKKLKWTTVSEYVDLETGEMLKQKDVKENYIIITKKKHYETDKTRGTTTITNECRRTNQGKLPFDNT